MVMLFRLPSSYLRHRYKLGLGLVLLADVGQAAEDQHSHDDDQHEEAEFLVAERWRIEIVVVGAKGL